MDRAVEAQTVSTDPVTNQCERNSMLTDFKWREKMFRVSPRIRFDSIVELRNHLLKEPDPSVATPEDME